MLNCCRLLTKVLRARVWESRPSTILAAYLVATCVSLQTYTSLVSYYSSLLWLSAFSLVQERALVGQFRGLDSNTDPHHTHCAVYMYDTRSVIAVSGREAS